MMKAHLATIACLLTIGFGASAAKAQSPGAIALSPDEWTVLTMAPNGSWGVGTDLSIHRAIASAIRMCRDMSSTQLGCGAVFTTVQAGWSLGVRCGEENILVADRNLIEAERIARERELELRFVDEIDLPACGRIVTVDPQGRVVAPQPETQIASENGRRVSR
jgi:hypothetical protein